LQFLIAPSFAKSLLFIYAIFHFFSGAAFLYSEMHEASAEELFNAGLYEKAEAAYLKMLRSNEQDLSPSSNALLQLSQLYTITHQYQKMNDLLKEFTHPQNDPALTYFAGLAYSRLHKHTQALKAFQNYLSSKDPSYTNEAHFEIALIYFSEKEYAKSLNELKQINHPKTNLQTLVAIYFARIYLQTDRAQEAIQLLNSHDVKVSDNDSTKFEIAFLTGDAHFLLREYEKAIPSLLQAADRSQDTALWYSDCLYQLGMSYLYSGDYEKATSAFHEFLKNFPEERGFLGLGEAYYLSGDHLNAEKLLSSHQFTTKNGQKAALLLQIKASPTYSARNSLYSKLIEMDPDSGSAWYYYALNDMEEGILLKSHNKYEEAEKMLLKAIDSFEKGLSLLGFSDKAMAAQALKYQAMAAHQNSQNLNGMHILEKLMDSSFWEATKDQDEILYLHGFFSLKQGLPDIAARSLQAAAAMKQQFGPVALKCLADSHYLAKNYSAAKSVYLQLTDSFPDSPLCAESLFFAAKSSAYLDEDPALRKKYLSQIFESYPQSPFAPESYFLYYSYQEYLQGDKQAIRHLQHFSSHFPATPFLIEANFLAGLNSRLNRKSPTGKWISKKNLTLAIDYFQEAETLFDLYAKEGTKISSSLFNYYISVRYRSTLERAKANLTIANESQGAKRQIYLNYATEVFKKIVDDFQDPANKYTAVLWQESPYPLIYQESLYELAKSYLAQGNDPAADQILSQMIAKYTATRSYYLSLSLFEKGLIALKQKDFAKSLELFQLADTTGKDLLSTDQKLDLWIQISLCYSGLMQYDLAILTLSKVVNDETISHLRLKAMFMRANLYTLDHRPELARKQLESLAQKKGEWAIKAKQQLEKEHDYFSF